MTRETQLEFDFTARARNQFKSRCYRCGQPVAPQEGLLAFFSLPGQTWAQAQGQRNWTLCEHDACAAKYAGTTTHFVLEPDNG